MSNHRGMTVNPEMAKVFAMILEQRTAFWTEEHAIKAKGQAGSSWQAVLSISRKQCCAVAGVGGTLMSLGGSWISSSLYMHTTTQQCGHRKALKFAGAS